MKLTWKFHFLILAAVLAFSSCKKDKDPQPDPAPVQEYGAVTLKFDNTVGNLPLQLNSTQYTNANGDTFNVSLYNYYISNIRLTASDNSVYTETESYHLVKASNIASLQFTLANVPVKNYTSITFMIGVDSTRNVSGAQTGALDPANGMFWSWNSGYIMSKLEGTSPQSPATNQIVMYHVGGFSGANNALKTVTLNFPGTANVSASVTPLVTIRSDAAEWFKTPVNVDISTLHTVHMAGASAKKIADNYADMFSVTSVQN